MKSSTSLLLACLFAAVGCSSNPTLCMTATLEPEILEGEVPGLAKEGQPAVMLLPASVETAAEYTRALDRLERVLIQEGVTVVPAGEVVEADSRVGLEEALSIAAGSGADILVQITEFKWTKNAKPSRFFVRGDSTFREVPEEEYRSVKTDRHAFNSPVLTCSARVMSTEGGAVAGSVQLRTAANWNLPKEYSASMEKSGGEWEADSESFDLSGDWWVADAKAESVRSVARWLAGRITSTR